MPSWSVQMAQLAHLKNVRRVLGDRVVKEMIESSEGEQFPSEKLSSFALLLGENTTNNLIFGNHERRKMDGADGLKAILCNWYGEELHKMKTDAALEKLVTALEHSDVNVKPLAAKIKVIKENKCEEKNKNSLSACSGRPNNPKTHYVLSISCPKSVKSVFPSRCSY